MMKRFLAIFLLIFTQVHSSTNDEDFFKEIIEYVYGENYFSQGGYRSVEKQFEGISLERTLFLDVGSGLGGPDFDLAQRYPMHIIGIDQDEVLVKQAQKAAEYLSGQLRGTVEFHHTKTPFLLSQFEKNTFDIIASKEAFLYVPFEKKEGFYRELHRILGKAGKLVVIDWIQKRPFSDETLKMMEMDGIGYHLNSEKEYVSHLKKAGFHNIQIEDLTEAYAEYTEENIDLVTASEEDFTKKFGKENFEYAATSWDYQKRAFQNGEIQVVRIIADK